MNDEKKRPEDPDVPYGVVGWISHLTAKFLFPLGLTLWAGFWYDWIIPVSKWLVIGLLSSGTVSGGLGLARHVSWLQSRSTLHRWVTIAWLSTSGPIILISATGFVFVAIKGLESAIDYIRQVPDVVGACLAVFAGVVAFVLRRYLRVTYGLVEISASIYLAMGFVEERYDIARHALGSIDPKDAVKGFWCASVYLLVRGLDNIEVGFVDKDDKKQDRLWIWAKRKYASRFKSLMRST
jgi:hypothetical protein